MTDAKVLDQLERLDAQATVGDWSVNRWPNMPEDKSVGVETIGRHSGRVVAFMRDTPHMPATEVEANAELIATMRNALKDLIKDSRELRRRILDAQK